MKLPPWAIFLVTVAVSSFLLTIGENDGLRVLSEQAPVVGGNNKPPMRANNNKNNHNNNQNNKNNQNNNNNNNQNNKKKNHNQNNIQNKQLYIEEVGPMPTVISSSSSSNNNNNNNICKKNAIVYMAQKHHSSYDRDSYGLLKESLNLLYANYLNDNHNGTTNVFIFHTGDFDEKDLIELESTRAAAGLIQLVDLTNTSYWHIPPWLRNDDPTKWSQHNVYSVGYRHMVSKRESVENE